MNEKELKPCPFKPIPNFEGIYWITKSGNVINADGMALKPYDNGYGYLMVDLKRNGKRKHARIHRLVAEAFIPNPYNLPEVNHKDENKHNNSFKNLEWCTNLENMRHSIETGLRTVKGENNPSAKLTAKDVENIRKEYIPKSKEFGTVALARKYGVSNVMIGKIIRYECWVDSNKNLHRHV